MWLYAVPDKILSTVESTEYMTPGYIEATLKQQGIKGRAIFKEDQHSDGTYVWLIGFEDWTNYARAKQMGGKSSIDSH